MSSLLTNIILYVIQCSESDAFYVGRTIQGQRRWKRHLSRLRAGKHENSRLQRIADKHGIDSLTFHVLAYVPVDDVVEAERSMVDDLLSDPNCINMAKVDGMPDTSGRVVTLLNRAKKRAALTHTSVDDALIVLQERDRKWGKGKGRGRKNTKYEVFEHYESYRIRKNVFNELFTEYGKLYRHHYEPLSRVPSFTLQHHSGKTYTGESYALAARELGLVHGSLKNLIINKPLGNTLKGWSVVSRCATAT